jgi:chromosome segregation ATPase
MFKKNKQTIIERGVYVSPTAEAEKSAKLRIERKQLEKENVEITKTLDEKRKSLSLYHNAFDKIKKEHLTRVEKLQNEVVDMINKINDKNSEYKNISEIVSGFVASEQSLKTSISSLEDKKDKLEKEVKESTEKLNLDKSNSDTYIVSLREKSDKLFAEVSDLEKSLDEAKKDLKSVLERIAEENRVLSIRKNDLEIYELRLRKQYPNELFIIN